MPVAKRPQTSAMLYTLITFIALFIVATTVAVIFYIKSEEYKTNAITLQNQLNDMANRQEIQRIGNLIGAKLPGKSRLGTMLDYLDNTVSMIIGGPLESTSAEVKVSAADTKTKDALQIAQQYLANENIDPNTTGLTSIIDKLFAKLDNIINAFNGSKENLAKLQQQFDDAITATQEKEKQLLAEKDNYYQQVVDITNKYNELKLLMEQTSDERARTLIARLEQERANVNKLNNELLKTQAELKMTKERMESALAELQKIKPLPDQEVAAYKPDGKVILVDHQTKVVHLNIGTDNQVYQGLTFSVYDRGAPIPRDGKGKAEVEVFAIAKNFSAARILRSEKKNPIAEDDIIANLIWDSDKTSKFLVVGEFDLDGDGVIDYEGIDSVKALIKKWGGEVIDNLSIDTDFVVIGNQPRVPAKPTFEDLAIDPMADERYEAAQKRLEHYKEVQTQAQNFRIPVLTYDKFLYFIGYKGQVTKAGAF